MTIGKKLRFEVFKRDNFTCKYCSRKPPEVVLEVDHVMPRSKGGKDEINNLVTSCGQCNRGKAAGNLFDTQALPDEADYLEAQQELAEAERYLLTRRKVDAAHRAMAERLAEVWGAYIEESAPSQRQLLQLLGRNLPDDIEDAIRRTSAASSQHKFQGDTQAALRYVQTCLNNKRPDQQEAS